MSKPTKLELAALRYDFTPWQRQYVGDNMPTFVSASGWQVQIVRLMVLVTTGILWCQALWPMAQSEVAIPENLVNLASFGVTVTLWVMFGAVLFMLLSSVVVWAARNNVETQWTPKENKSPEKHLFAQAKSHIAMKAMFAVAFTDSGFAKKLIVAIHMLVHVLMILGMAMVGYHSGAFWFVVWWLCISVCGKINKYHVAQYVKNMDESTVAQFDQIAKESNNLKDEDMGEVFCLSLLQTENANAFGIQQDENAKLVNSDGSPVTWVYIGNDPGGRERRGTVEAPSKQAAFDTLRKTHKIFPTSIELQ